MSQSGTFGSGGGGSGTVITLTGNVGGAVNPDGAGNINLVGTNPITITGNPGAWSQTVTVADATVTQKGVSELATDAETITGTDSVRTIVPTALKAKLGLQTQYGIPYGATTTSAIAWTGAGSDGELLIAATGAIPSFAALTSSGGFITFTPGANTLDLNTAGSVAVSFDADSGTATPALGVLNIISGANITTSAAGSSVTVVLSGTTQYSLQLGNATGSLDSLGVAGNGEIPIGSVGVNPVLANITTTDGTLTVTNGPGTIDVEAGTGLKIMTGFSGWTGGAPYFDDTVLGSFTVSQAGLGYIGGEPVLWAGGQTTAGMTAGNTYYIYIDNTGTIGKTTTYNDALFRDYIVLFECMRDSTAAGNIQITVKENHPYQFPWATSVWAHDVVGAVIANNQGGANITLNGTQKIEISGADELEDHGLETDIPDSGGVAETFEQYFTLGSGKWARYTSSDTFDGTYNNAGTATALAGGKYGVYTLYVSKDNINVATPVYFAVLDTSEYNNLNAAQTAVANGSTATASGELAALELAQLGFIIFEESSTTIVDVIIFKETLRSSFTGVASSVASLVLTDVTNFDHILSAADTTVQSALETIDDLTLTSDAGNAQAAAAIFTIAGGTGLTSAAAGSTVTVNLDSPVSVANGGTGLTTITDHALMVGSGAGAITPLAASTDGQIPIGNTGSDPTIAAITAGANITVVNGAGSITIAGTVSGFNWSIITADLDPMVVDTGYICNKAGLLDLKLPATSAVGTVLRVTGMNTDLGWVITQRANQIIHCGGVSTTTGVGGSLASILKRDSLELVCVVADLEWNAISGFDNMTIV